MSGIAVQVQYIIQFPILNRYPVLPKSHVLVYINNVQCPCLHDCRRIQCRPSPSLEIILPVKLFVLFGYPLKGGVNIGNLPLSYYMRALRFQRGKTYQYNKEVTYRT